jgi:hypothetical protein
VKILCFNFVKFLFEFQFGLLEERFGLWRADPVVFQGLFFWIFVGEKDSRVGLEDCDVLLSDAFPATTRECVFEIFPLL